MQTESEQIKKFLQFNDKNIYFTNEEGKYWIALKPMCDALQIDYEAQRKRLNNDKTLQQLPSNQTVVAADGKLREMVCLPEFFIYGWIFSIQSNSDELTEYQLKCYELLYNYFHGSTKDRNDILKQKTLTELKIDKLQEKLQATDAYKELLQLKAKAKQTIKQLYDLDRRVVAQQLELWESEVPETEKEPTEIPVI